jgi:hypothetical protein
MSVKLNRQQLLSSLCLRIKRKESKSAQQKMEKTKGIDGYREEINSTNSTRECLNTTFFGSDLL